MIKKIRKPLTKRVVKDAKTSLMLRVTPKNVIQGIPGDQNCCVLACSLKAHFGDVIEGVEVGTRVTKIYTHSSVVRYGTPTSFRDPIKIYDRTGLWTIPVGEYEFPPLPPTLRIGGSKNTETTCTTVRRRRHPKMFNARTLPTRRSFIAADLASL